MPNKYGLGVGISYVDLYIKFFCRYVCTLNNYLPLEDVVVALMLLHPCLVNLTLCPGLDCIEACQILKLIGSN